MKNPVNASVGNSRHSILVILCALLILAALWDATGFPSVWRVPAPDNDAKVDWGAYRTKVKGNAIKNIAAGDMPTFTGQSTISGSKLNSHQPAINNGVIVQPGRASRQGWNITAEKLQAADLMFLAGGNIQQGSAITSTSRTQFTNGSAEMRGGGGVIAKDSGTTLAPAAGTGVNRFWGNNSGGDWSSKANWVPIDPDPAGPDTDPPSVPAAGDSATFGVDARANDGDSDDDQGNSIGTYVVTVNGNTIDGVGIGTATITFNLAGSFTVTNGFGLANQTSDVTISGSGAMSSGTIDLGGGKFTISQASVSTGDFIGTSGGTLLIHNGGTLTSGANTTMSVGIIATVDGANSQWTNSGLLTANSLNITNGAMVKTDSANIGFGGLNLTGGSFNGGALSASLVNATANSQLTDTSVLLNAAANSTLDASTWDISGKFTGGSASFLTIKNGARMGSDSAELLLSAGVKVDSAVWINTNDLTIQQSAGNNAGLDVENAGVVTVGGNLVLFGSANLNNTSKSASELDVTGHVDAESGGNVSVGQNATMTSKGVFSVSGADSSGFVFGSSFTIAGTWTNTGDFIVGQSGPGGPFAENDLTVNAFGKLTTSSDLIVGQQSFAPNVFSLNSGGTVMDVNGVLAQAAGVTTNAFVDGTWTNTGKLTVADAGTARLTIGFSTANGVVSSLDATVGNQPGSNGSVGVRNGSMWNVNGNLILGAGGTGSAFVERGSMLSVTGSTILGRDKNSTGTLTLDNTASRFTSTGGLQVGVNGTGTVNVESGFNLNLSAQSLVLGKMAGAFGILNVRNASTIALFKDATIGSLGAGTVLVEDTGLLHNLGNVILGEMAGGNGAATITGMGTKWQIDGNLVVGLAGDTDPTGAKGIGHVVVMNGGELAVNGQSLTLGQEAGGQGTLTLDGFASKLSGAGSTNVEIGRHGEGTLQLLNGAQFSMNLVTLGALSGGDGIVKVDGMQNGIPSTLNVNSALTIGGVSGASGEVDITNGGQVIARNAAVIGRDAGSSGVVMLSGQGSTWNIMAGGIAGTGDLTVGQAGTGTLSVADQAKLVVNNFTVGESAAAAGVTVSGQATLTTNGMTILGKNNGAIGTVNVLGGNTDGTEWDVNGPITIGDAGRGEISIRDGGKVVFNGPSAIVAKTGSGAIAVSNGTLQVNVSDFVIGQGGVGSLTITRGGAVNAGIITLGDSAGSGSSGTITVDGTIRPTDTVSGLSASSLFIGGLGHGQLSVIGGGIVFAGEITVASSAGGSGNLLVDGAGSKIMAPGASLDIGLNGPGGIQISNGGSVETNSGFINSNDSGLTRVVTGTNSRWDIGSLGLVIGGFHAADFQISDNGKVFVNGPVTIGKGNLGVLRLSGGAQLETFSADSLVIGDQAPGNVFITDGSTIVANAGFSGTSSTTTMIEAGSLVQVINNGSNFLNTNLSITGASRLQAFSGGHVAVGGALKVSAGSSVDTTSGSIDIGTTSGQAPAGQIQVGFGGSLKDNGAVTGNVVTQLGGRIGGSGTINGKLINGGTVAPGDPQTLTVSGDYQQLSGGLLQIAIAGKTLPEFDHLNVTGHITLDMGANLELDFINGFAPKTGDKFDFLQSGDPLITGAFSNVTITGLAPGFEYTLAPDGVGSFGLIALNDGVATSVPEPSTYAMLALGAALLLIRLRHRRPEKTILQTMKTNTKSRNNALTLFSIVLAFLSAAVSGFASSATWSSAPGSGDWNTAANWTPNTVPNGAADIASFGTSATTSVGISANTQVSGITFNSGASAFTITANPTITLTISGVGITNSSGVTQTFVTTFTSSFSSGAVINFTNSATAGSMTLFNNNGGFSGFSNGSIQFFNTSTAGSGTFNNNGSSNGGSGGILQFFNTSTAGSGTFTNNGGTAGGGGQTLFNDSSTAGSGAFTTNGSATAQGSGGVGFTQFSNSSSALSGTFTTNPGAVNGAAGGVTAFQAGTTAANGMFTTNGAAVSGAGRGITSFNDATAANGTFTNNAGTASGAAGGETLFQGFGGATAASSTIINNGGTVSGALGGNTQFFNTSTAGSATLIANGGTSGGLGGFILFQNDSTGGTARVEVFGNGNLDISAHNAPGVTTGSLHRGQRERFPRREKSDGGQQQSEHHVFRRDPG